MSLVEDFGEKLEGLWPGKVSEEEAAEWSKHFMRLSDPRRALEALSKIWAQQEKRQRPSLQRFLREYHGLEPPRKAKGEEGKEEPGVSLGEYIEYAKAHLDERCELSRGRWTTHREILLMLEELPTPWQEALRTLRLDQIPF